MPDTRELTPIEHSKAPYYWGIDVGGTGIKMGLVDSEGQTVAFEAIQTLADDGGPAAIERVSKHVSLMEESLGLKGQVPYVGLGAPGPMDLRLGLLVEPPQLPKWHGYGIVEDLQKRIERPIIFLNDANAAAYGEFWVGGGRTSASMLLLTLGTGVGGGIVNDNQLINGVNSFGSECGHIVVDSRDDARLCGWGGGRGQLEAYASATGVAIEARKRLEEGVESTLRELPSERVTSKAVYLAALKGDQMAVELVDETAYWLGVGITSLVHTLDPGVVVLGGAMNFGGLHDPIGQRFLRGIVEEFKRRTFEQVFEGTKIEFATLGSDAGFLGLAGYARREHTFPTSI
ncbi:MAG: ROK family protein [Planctomycetota bacterium]